MAGKDVSGTDVLGALLRGYRAAANMTQEELAERAGLSVHAIAALERGRRRTPRTSTIEFLAGALDLSPQQREALVTAARGGTVHQAAGPVAPPELPLPGSDLIGRDDELAQACQLLSMRGVRLLTLTGPPGSGKTRLALEIATRSVGRYPHGVTVVSLGPLGDSTLVMTAVCRALGVTEAGGETPADAVDRHCREREMLLVLDNFEHVLPAAPEVAHLLNRCAGLDALVTSRAALRVRDEREMPVPPLAVPDADVEPAGVPVGLRETASVRLFMERAEAILPGFRLTAGNAGAVAAICLRLDGLPLALELAAPWLRLLSPAQLLERLDNRLELLEEGARDLPDRQRTMRHALRWSYELLDEQPRALLRRLSVFAGGASLDGVERVGQAAGTLSGGVLRHLAVLADHSLVHRVEAAAGEPRVTMLESVREYAFEELAAADEWEVTAEAHLAFHADLAGQARSGMKGTDQASWLRRLGLEHDNLRAALAHARDSGRVDSGLRLATDLGPFWDYGGHRQEGLQWLRRLLAAGSANRPGRADALGVAGYLAWHLGDHDAASSYCRESLAISRALSDPRRIATALYGLGLAAGSGRDHDGAIHFFEEALATLRDLDDRELRARALLNLGTQVGHRGDHSRAAGLFEEALRLQREHGNALGEALCLLNLGAAARATHDVTRARTCLDQSVAIARRLDSPYHLAAALAHLGDLARTSGDGDGGAAHYRESLSLFAGIGSRFGVSVCLRRLAWLAWRDDHGERAARLYGAASTLSPSGPADQTDVDATVGDEVQLREQLGRRRFEAAYESGRRLSMEEAATEGQHPA